MQRTDPKLAIANPDVVQLSLLQKFSVVLGISGLTILFLGIFNINLPFAGGFLTYGILSILISVILYSYELYAAKTAGIKNDHTWQNSLTNRGVWGWVAGILLTTFYVILYFYPAVLGLGQGLNGANSGVIALFDPLSKLLSGNPASQWFVYGTLYTLAILAFGIKFIWKYRHSNYHMIRTISIIFFQTAFAFLIPEFMARLNGDIPYYDLKNVWPLNYYNFEEYRIQGFLENGNLGWFMLIFGIVSIFIITPILTYFYGKRWYCSWVCGCGGLAETAGDPFRQLSDKSMNAWRVERWVIHSVLVFSVLMTTAVIYTYLGYNNDDGTPRYLLNKNLFLISVGLFLGIVFLLVWIFKRKELKKDAKLGMIGYFVIILGLIGIHFAFNTTLFNFPSETLRKSYGFLIGSMFSGVIGTGFYPIFGNRVWCRFGCPMAAILGLQQRLFSRFRITTNGGQCISCGNCSTYCEMGIDVRAYAQKGENIVRASCVGCGVCSAVCPRGVLKLENSSLNNRINPTEIPLGNDINLMELLNKS